MSTSGSVISCRRRGPGPLVGSSSRFTQRSSVDLPEPDGPDDAHDLALADSRSMPAQHLVVAEGLVQVLDLDRGRRRRRRSRGLTGPSSFQAADEIAERDGDPAGSTGRRPGSAWSWRSVLARSRPNLVSSTVLQVTPRTRTSEESLMSRTSSLVSGGMTIRNACGMTIETIARRVRHAERPGRLHLALGHGLDARPDGLRHVGRGDQAERRGRPCRRCRRGSPCPGRPAGRRRRRR